MLEPSITTQPSRPMVVKVNGKPLEPVTPIQEELEVLPTSNTSSHYGVAPILLGLTLGTHLFYSHPSTTTSREYYTVDLIDIDAAYDEMTKFINFLHTLAQSLENLAWALFSLSIAAGLTIFLWKIVKTIRQHY